VSIAAKNDGRCWLTSALTAATRSAKAAQHSWWGNPANGRRSAVPRHTEVDEYLARKICRDLGIPDA